MKIYPKISGIASGLVLAVLAAASLLSARTQNYFGEIVLIGIILLAMIVSFNYFKSSEPAKEKISAAVKFLFYTVLTTVLVLLIGGIILGQFLPHF